MIGGPDSFGAGGFLGTPVEAALPVDMDIKQRKVLPRGALVLVMHTCEIPDGNVWAREIGLASLNALSSRDLMGALGYFQGVGGSVTGHSWLYNLQQVGDKTLMRRTLTKMASEIGDMPDVGTTLKMAYYALLKADAAVKRVVIISDGDPAAPPAELLSMLSAAKISVSTVCIAPHSDNDVNMLRWVAAQTGGQFYHVTNPQNLPQIFTKEASVVRRGILVEEPFVPRSNHDSEILTGVSGSALPTLRGLVVTTAKDKAVVPLVSHEDDPLLAHWRYGLGKSVAFTSDVTSRWARDWLTWEGFNRFWAQTVRWAMREVTPSNFRVETSLKEGQGHVRVDAVDQHGRFVNFLKPRALVSGPAPDFARHDVELTQTGPGIYEAGFPLGSKGAYVINVTHTRGDGSTSIIPAGLSLGYSQEYEHNTSNLSLLGLMVKTSGGRMLGASDNPFSHDLKSAPTITPVWQYLAVVAALVFPVEIFVRRVVVSSSAIYAPVAKLLRRIPGLGRIVPVPTGIRLPATGRYASAAPGPFGTESLEPFGTGQAGKPSLESTGDNEPVDGGNFTKRLLDAKKRALEPKRSRRG
jgi:hypothetical protein